MKNILTGKEESWRRRAFPCSSLSVSGRRVTSSAELLAGASPEQIMKPQEVHLVQEISKLQSMVTELRVGFSGALLELGHIQHGDLYLKEGEAGGEAAELPEESPAAGGAGGVAEGGAGGDEEAGAAAGRRDRQTERRPARGKLLLHCFLQGLKAGLSEGTDARHQVAMQLLHSEWEYVSTLNQLYDRYRTPPAHQLTVEPNQTHVKFVEQLLQRHLLFRNTLQERLSTQHWKSLVGDILVQLIGQNDTAFSDTYLGYTSTLASFLSLEFSSLTHVEKRATVQTEEEELKLLSLLLAPVTRIHSYLSHIQNLLQWTGKEHPDCSLLLGSERALRSTLSRCHVILEEEVRWGEEEEAGQSSCDAAVASSANCCHRAQVTRDEPSAAAHRDGKSSGGDGCLSMRLECWSCSPVRRKGCRGEEEAGLAPRRCAHACCTYACGAQLTPDPAGWGENSDSGQGTFSQRTARGTTELEASRTNPSLEDGETDPEDTSAFDYSSVTSCSPDGTLRREVEESNSGEYEEEDSQVPVLLRPSGCPPPAKEAAREKTVCLRWQIPRQTPPPPLRNPTGPSLDGPAPCLLSTFGKRLVSVRRGSPPLHPKSAFRPIWDDPTKQTDSAPEKDSRPGFVPVQTPGRQNFYGFGSSRDDLRAVLAHQRGGGGGPWDSEDSEDPCSTV
ncbi:hypothetical protein OJAV_G00217830 [Oryzias javanicus]|uniref:DH domain-containing protein n=1 Tax=Oryzias javanicus TaxID=123683 RepID=A0A437C4T9_ORYJA|nr:hypothetical protein OJAV_G00217830 [Oryzias javanicus]